MRSKHLAAASLIAAAACGSDTQPAPETQVADTPAAEISVVEFARRHFDAVPDSVLVRGGACPFECCVYGEWRAETAIPLAVEPRTGADSVGSIAVGETFPADTGFVRITGPAIIAVTDTVRVRDTTLLPGDTVVVLDYVGEGYWNLLHRGRVLEEVEGFWGAEHDDPRGAYYGDYRKEWWVHARGGWFRADSTFRFSGADACGG